MRNFLAGIGSNPTQNVAFSPYIERARIMIAGAVLAPQ
jgi:hypothetical protein